MTAEQAASILGHRLLDARQRASELRRTLRDARQRGPLWSAIAANAERELAVVERTEAATRRAMESWAARGVTSFQIHNGFTIEVTP